LVEDRLHDKDRPLIDDRVHVVDGLDAEVVVEGLDAEVVVEGLAVEDGYLNALIRVGRTMLQSIAAAFNAGSQSCLHDPKLLEVGKVGVED
jgi:hypothetical protein